MRRSSMPSTTAPPSASRRFIPRSRVDSAASSASRPPSAWSSGGPRPNAAAFDPCSSTTHDSIPPSAGRQPPTMRSCREARRRPHSSQFTWPSSSSTAPASTSESSDTTAALAAGPVVAPRTWLRSLAAVLVASLLLSVLTSMPVGANAQAATADGAGAGAGAVNNVTALSGMWSSGSGAVKTGLEFYNPITKVFNVPKTAGVAYSFTDDMFFETAQFMWQSNPKDNRCFKAVLIWQHGNYSLNANGSLSLFPFTPDGRIQVMDPCAATSVSQYLYAEYELIPRWTTFQEAHPGFRPAGDTVFALQMYNAGANNAVGAPKSPLYLLSRPPNMLPTSQLYQEVLNTQPKAIG